MRVDGQRNRSRPRGAAIRRAAQRIERRLSIDADDKIARLQAGFRRRRVGLHGRDFPIFMTRPSVRIGRGGTSISRLRLGRLRRLRLLVGRSTVNRSVSPDDAPHSLQIGIADRTSAGRRRPRSGRRLEDPTSAAGVPSTTGVVRRKLVVRGGSTPMVGRSRFLSGRV